MRHLHTESHFRLAIAALRGPDGYVEALLGLARDKSWRDGPRSPTGFHRRRSPICETTRPEAERICTDGVIVEFSRNPTLGAVA